MSTKKIIFDKLVLLTEKSKKGFLCNFDDKITVITGPIDTGKSSIVKHIFYSLGCNVIIDQEWKTESPYSLLVCSINDVKYAFLRKDKLRAIFRYTETGNELLAHGYSSSAITPTIHQLFDFNLELTMKSTRELVLAESSVLFAPYYIDQDYGWTEALESFSQMQMYDKWKASAIDFHSGVKPNAYYKLGAEIRTLTKQIEELRLERKALDKAFIRFKLDSKEGIFNIDMQEYENTLEELLKKCQELNIVQIEHRTELSKLMDKRIELVSERDMAQQVINSIENYSFVTNTDPADHYLNLSKKSSLIDAKNEVAQLIFETDKEIELQRSVIDENRFKSEEIKQLIEQHETEITFSDIIKSESKKDVKTRFQEEIEKVENEIKEILLVIDGLKQSQKKFLDGKRTKSINETFREYAYSVLHRLQVSPNQLGTIGQHKKVTESATGSRKPRAIFAYHYALLRTISKHTDTPSFPIVIDSPKQQEMDVDGVKPLLEVCTSDLGPLSQLIISSVEFDKKDYSGFESAKIVRLESKGKLLDTSNYEEAWETIEPLLVEF